MTTNTELGKLRPYTMIITKTRHRRETN